MLFNPIRSKQTRMTIPYKFGRTDPELRPDAASARAIAVGSGTVWHFWSEPQGTWHERQSISDHRHITITP